MKAFQAVAAATTLVLHAASQTEAMWAGVGIADATGPVADVNLMGYAMPAQLAGGIHTRLRARAFVFGADNGDGLEGGKERVAFVSIDNGMGSWAVVKEVVARLEKRYPGVYSHRNICVSGTHTHSASAGFLQYFLFQVTSLGFVHEAFEAYVSGIEMAVVRAHESARSGRQLWLSRGKMRKDYASINRSPSAYRQNPKEERDKYADGDTDLDMTVLSIEEADGTPVGLVNWFAVHGTTLPNTNKLVSGDNKGYASLLFEHWMNGDEWPTGKPGGYVAAFAATNLGDVSPNINGTFCSDSGAPCEELHSTCHGQNEFCHGRGPAQDPLESVAIIGTRQAVLAKSLSRAESYRVGVTAEARLTESRLGMSFFEGSNDESQVQRVRIEGQVRFVHAFRDLSNVHVRLANGSSVQTCGAAMGYSFAAGTTDGPGAFNFFQGENVTTTLWEIFRDLLAVPSQRIKECQHPKPVLLPTGEMEVPYSWDPSIVPLQVFLLGDKLAMINVPSEYTTMAGRRLREAVKTALGAALAPDGMVIIAGLSNEYSSYVTTREEFGQQRYEGGSTIFGPHTLEAYTQELVELAKAVASGKDVEDPGPFPPDFSDKLLSLLPAPLPDMAGFHGEFGKVLKDVESAYDLTKDPHTVISATFQSANPRNDPRPEGTFLGVERLSKSDKGEEWVQVRTDSDVDTRYVYKRVNPLESHVTVEWQPSQSLKSLRSGTYRIAHYGDRKLVHGKTKSFQGYSSPFTLV